ncbi:tetratricopeptide repeat protein [Tannerella serpentiformis]|jgi:tetratricopeptide repeat protein|nr:tetratricopeptide repeat protein [Tannerella serpentiformis]AOH40617.1 tetratricopeptide repeat protein [Tannerella serpentiformis]AVV52277.1 tetratricopeptide repeat protein [Tannerella serpentiformis]RKW66402.1 MAG: tetratricopeptide repeat protein [Tannerella sp.]
MKRVLVTIGLCLMTTVVFGQKKAVSDAERIAKDSKPDFNEARTLIKGAMENAETKDDAKTWYVAGLIEDTQFSTENMKQILGQKPDEAVMYEALGNILPYFKESYRLDQLPNEKGKVKPKYTKNIKGTLNANILYYLNGGAYFFDQRNYKRAHDFFEQYLEIADLPFMKGEKAAARDSNFMIVQFYAAIAAMQMDDPQQAIKDLNRAKGTDYRRFDVYQSLCYVYDQVLKDTVGLEKTLEEGMKLFPDSSYFLNNMINVYISTKRNEQAMQLLNTAISKSPNNPQLYFALGSLYEVGLKDEAKAEEAYKKALDLDPENPSNIFSVGRLYFNQGVSLLDKANSLNDQNQYKAEKAKAEAMLRKALPFFEKAHKLKPEEREYMIGLRGIYYNLSMNKEFDAINAEMSK